ncbi:hypothetical protein [Microbulbifer sp.]|uniref:hypothetical protein n=1 Tax=Microbulbifer sp. TaxID=1908541 RepID=UPI003F3A885B
MEYGKSTLGTLLWVGVVLSAPAGAAESTTSASASARITLYVPPRAEWRQTDNPDTDQLCLSHIPAHSYYLSVRNIGEGTAAEERFPGQAGSYCISLSTSQQGKMVLIVAE